MGVKVVFNPDTRVIEIKTGVTEIDVAVDLYSDGKEDWLTDTTLNKLEFPFIPIGGNSLGPGQVSPAYFFLRYPWKIQTPGDGTIISIALNLYGLAENGIDSRSQADTYIIQAGDGLAATNSNLPGFDTEMNNAIRFASFNGGITVDTTYGTPGTEYPIGTDRDPVNNIPDAVYIGAIMGLNQLYILGDLDLATGDYVQDYQIWGDSINKTTITIYDLANVTNTEFSTATVTGILDGNNTFDKCKIINNLNFVEGSIQNCTLCGCTIKLAGTTNTQILNCASGDPEIIPTIDFDNKSLGINIRNYAGTIEFINKTSAEDSTIDFVSGKFYMAASVTSGEIRIRGIGTGYIHPDCTATINTDGFLCKECITDAVWNEVITAGTYNIPSSAGRRLRQLSAYNITDGFAQEGYNHGIKLKGSETAGDHIYNRNLIVIIDGTGKGQTRTIVDYDGTTKIAVVDRNWWTNPDNTSEYFILPDDTPLVTDHGIATAGTSNTITIRTAASAISSTYSNNTIQIMAGTGQGQSRLIDSYDGTTKIVTIHDIWTTIPDTTSVYVILPYASSNVSDISPDALTLINTEIESALSAHQPLIDIHDEAFGKWVLDTGADTMTYYKEDGFTQLAKFNLPSTIINGNKVYTGRTPIP